LPPAEVMAEGLEPAALLLAALAVLVMGFAIQRGATCLVAAVRQLAEGQGAARLLALAEAAAWVSGGLIVVRALGLAMAVPPDHELTWRVVAGGALLGLGAVVAGACVFGAIGRLGAGEWGFAATPLGFFCGCLVLARAGIVPDPALAGASAPLVMAPAWFVAPIVCLAVVRLLWRQRSGGHRGNDGLWHPHDATIVIALAFVLLMFLAGPWAYTDSLARLARGDAAALPQGLLLAALVGGAVLGAWRGGRLASRPPDATTLLRCFAGGALMAIGSMLVPGSNDGLILVGLPHLQGFAWAAMAAMLATIWLAIAAESRLKAWRQPA